MTELSIRDSDVDIEDRLILKAQRPEDHTEWLRVLPTATPLFVHVQQDQLDLLVRWDMSWADADGFGFTGCACCGATVPQEGGRYEFDTELGQINWYLEGASA